MKGKTGIHVRVDDEADDVRNRVRFELDSGSAIESLVLAYRLDGELVELAERKIPAAAELHGELE